MADRNFRELLQGKWDEGKSVCVGLDPVVDKLPEILIPRGFGQTVQTVGHMFEAFCRPIVDATKHIACAYKPNVAFYERYGDDGISALCDIVEYIREAAPDVPIILDAKRADIGTTNEGYAGMAFRYLEADAITVSPYLGREALEPFLKEKNKGVIVLCRTSNPGAGEFQDLPVPISKEESEHFGRVGAFYGWNVTTGFSTELYKHVAYQVSQQWNTNGNCAVVVGATYPHELAEVRKIVGDTLPILIPGIGAQGGDLEKAVAAGMNSNSQGMIINASSSIIFASAGPNFADAARVEALRLHEKIRECVGIGMLA